MYEMYEYISHFTYYDVNKTKRQKYFPEVKRSRE